MFLYSLILVVPLFANLVFAKLLKSDLDFEWDSGITAPGTNWCGPGNEARDFSDLGPEQDVDKCCRAHDMCDNIPAGEEKYGLKNTHWFTRLHCDCDMNFKRCLKEVNSTFSAVVGTGYFMSQSACYKKEHPIVKCKKSEKKEVEIIISRCVEYEVDNAREEVYQWFDLPVYSSDYGTEWIGTE